LETIGLKCFQERAYDIVRRGISSALFEKITRERNGESVDGSIIKDGINFIIRMGLGTLAIYEKDFEKDFILESSAYYRRVASRWIQEYNCSEYLSHAENRLVLEQILARKFLHSSTESKLARVIEDVLIRSYAARLMEMEGSGLAHILKNQQYEGMLKETTALLTKSQPNQSSILF